jgi:formylglycine-generating enzyme required for sulfatase activity
MKTTRRAADEPQAEGSTTPEETQPAPRSTEEVARELGAAGTGGASRTAAESEGPREGGPLRLDKSGALLGRPKLRPVRALRPESETPAAPAARRERPSAPGRPRRAALPPRLADLRPEAVAPPPPPDDEVVIPAGTFLRGEPRKPCELAAFRIDRIPVTNAAYARFVRETGHRPALYWDENGTFPEELADHPVVGVDYYDALAYARWCGRDLPFEDEWERAARGTDGRVFPWGNDPELSGANTARVGLKCTVPVDLHGRNVSPDGVRDMVGNAWELTHSPAPGGGVVVRGGSWYDFALYAKTFFRFASRPDARNGTIGFRCVRRGAERPDASREVSSDRADAEIAARRGPQPPVDRAAWSVEKRDLLPDLPRLRSAVMEARAEALLATMPPASSAPPVASAPPVSSAPAEAAATSPVAPAPESPAAPGPDARADARADEPLGAAVVAAAPGAEAAPVPQPERLHVEDPTSAPAPRAPAPRADPARARARLWRPRATPATLWVLLAVGFLLCGGLLLLLGLQDEPAAGPADSGAPAEPVAVAPGPLAELPEAPAAGEGPGWDQPPRVFDAAYPSDRARLDRGLWLLLILDPRTEAGQQSLEAAHDLHRRLAPHGVSVTVVLPRAAYEDADGKLLPDEELDKRLRTDGRGWLWDGIHVALDPAGKDGRGLLAGRYAFPDESVAAMLLHDGRVESRTAPPEGGFTLASLAHLAVRALRLAGR